MWSPPAGPHPTKLYAYLSSHSCHQPQPKPPRLVRSNDDVTMAVAARSKARVCGALLHWDCGFQLRCRYGCLSLEGVGCCQVEVSATDRSLVQRSPTECGVFKWMWSRGLDNEEALAHYELSCRGKNDLEYTSWSSLFVRPIQLLQHPILEQYQPVLILMWSTKSHTHTQQTAKFVSYLHITP